MQQLTITEQTISRAPNDDMYTSVVVTNFEVHNNIYIYIGNDAST